MSGLNGFPTQQKTGNARPKYVTIQSGGKDRYGIHTAPIGLFPTTPAAQSVVSYNPETGVVEITGHGAREGDLLRITQAGVNNRIEVPILEILSADLIKIAKEVLVADLIAADTLFVMRPITASFNEDGNTVVAVNVGPISYRLDAVSTEVSQDTGTPANSRPLPVRALNSDGTEADVDLSTLNTLVKEEDDAILAQEEGAKIVGRRIDLATFLSWIALGNPDVIVDAEGDAIQQIVNEYGARYVIDPYVVDEITNLGTKIDTLNAGLDVVDQLDAELLSVQVSNIPGNASAPLEVVASLAADVKKIKVVDDIGEYVGLYVGASTFEVLKAILPLGGGDLELNLAAGDRISLRNMKAGTIATDTFMAINFLG